MAPEDTCYRNLGNIVSFRFVNVMHLGLYEIGYTEPYFNDRGVGLPSFLLDA